MTVVVERVSPWMLALLLFIFLSSFFLGGRQTRGRVAGYLSLYLFSLPLFASPMRIGTLECSSSYGKGYKADRKEEGEGEWNAGERWGKSGKRKTSFQSCPMTRRSVQAARRPSSQTKGKIKIKKRIPDEG